MAIIAPGFLFLIFFSIQAALYMYGRAVATQAAREGVSQLRLAADRDSYDQIRDAVVANTERFAGSVGRESLTRPTAVPQYDDAAGRVSMRVSGKVISLLVGLDLTVHEDAYGEVERFRSQ